MTPAARHLLLIGSRRWRVNDIGTAGTAGFGVGICPAIPSGFTALAGASPTDPNYGNYQYSDGSIMVWVPAFYYRIGSASSPRYATYGANAIDVLPYSAFVDVAAANAAGYALHRAFYDDGQVQRGFFVDKYLCSNKSGTASSIALGNPLSTNAAHNPLSGLTGAPANAYYGTIAAAKTRGASFFPASRFIGAALALLSAAHGQAATSSAVCAWYDATLTSNFPKGCNNNARGDTNDGTLTFTSDGYSNAAKTGSANNLAKTAHNGQACGVVDLNGGMWEVQLGISSDGSSIYLLKTSAKMASITDGVSLATDAWGATGLAALYDNVGTTIESLIARNALVRLGNAANQVFGADLSGAIWTLTGAGIPLAAGVSAGGSALFGNDGLNDYKPNQMCPLGGGAWAYGANAGVWAVSLSNARGNSSDSVGFRAASYL